MSVERRNGPHPVLKENAIANYVCEMTLTGMGLVQNFLKKDKRKKNIEER